MMSAGLALKIHLKHHTFKRSAAQASHPDALFQRNGHEDATSVIAAAGKQIYIREWQLTATRDEMVTRHAKWRAQLPFAAQHAAGRALALKSMVLQMDFQR